MNLIVTGFYSLFKVLLLTIILSNNAFSASKTQKMKAQIKQQQATIDLLKLKLKKCRGGSYSNAAPVYSPTGSDHSIIPQTTISYP